jgi:hypothetical protein
MLPPVTPFTYMRLRPLIPSRLPCIDLPSRTTRSSSNWKLHWLWLAGALIAILLAGCASPGPAPAPAPYDAMINLDAETQALISRAQRTVFLIPFSHWDTDWHADYQAYSRQADGNILAAIRLAKANPRFRYTLEQVLFVQHFWQNHPEEQADLKALVENRQITFAWGGITQPETSLAAPGVQLHDLLLGREWISDTFGSQALPVTAWQSDAFGNSAALPLFLEQAGISQLYIGRWQNRCDPDYENCQPLPAAFYWKSPLPQPAGAQPNRILVTYLSYPTAWAALLNQHTSDEKLASLEKVITEQFGRSDSRYLFLPFGFDFTDPDPALPNLVERWNSVHTDTALVFADPETAFRYLETQDLPEFSVDLNPIWQAFYGTRPYAKIADKESEFYLSAADKFGLVLGEAQPQAWQAAAVNAHYDNVSAVGYDQVWESSQRPRFAEAVSSAAAELAARIADIAGRVNDGSGPLLVFNSLSWARSGVVEIHGALPEDGSLPASQQLTGPDSTAVMVKDIPPIGYAPAGPGDSSIPNPVEVIREAGGLTLSNSLVSVSLDAAHGGTFSSLSLPGEEPIDLLAGYGDDTFYIEDNGDVYGASFEGVKARQSQVTARLDVDAQGPLLGRASVYFSLGGQPVTKTVTLRADNPLVEVTLQMRALPQTSALTETPTIFKTETRTDDLGFAAFSHKVDTHLIQPGDVTYRREIFYPITYWSDVSSASRGVSLITHGLQGVGGGGNLYLLLARSVSDNGKEGVNDTELHTLRYAYYPHQGDVNAAKPWLQAYEFNQPLIPAWVSGEDVHIQIPFQGERIVKPTGSEARKLPETYSLASTENGVIVDLYLEAGETRALVVNYNPLEPASLQTASGETKLPPGWLWLGLLNLSQKTGAP